MKKVLLFLCVTTFVFLGACSDYTAPPKIAETNVTSTSAVVESVTFLNVPEGWAATRISVSDAAGRSMVKHNLPGYHPEIVPGTEVSLTNLYQVTQERFGTHDRFLTRVCAHPKGAKAVCIDEY
jgi:hypothetical protein